MFPVLHEMLVNKEMAELEVVPRSNGIVLSLALLEGKLAKLDREIHADQPLFETMCSAPRTQRYDKRTHRCSPLSCFWSVTLRARGLNTEWYLPSSLTTISTRMMSATTCTSL